MTFVGFDLHKRHITACALDASGVVVAEIRQLTTTLAPVLATVLATMVEWLVALPAQSRSRWRRRSIGSGWSRGSMIR
jgi:hypothetical protein